MARPAVFADVDCRALDTATADTAAYRLVKCPKRDANPREPAIIKVTRLRVVLPPGAAGHEPREGELP